jgi:hypothetical protein
LTRVLLVANLRQDTGQRGEPSRLVFRRDNCAGGGLGVGCYLAGAVTIADPYQDAGHLSEPLSALTEVGDGAGGGLGVGYYLAGAAVVGPR